MALLNIFGVFIFIYIHIVDIFPMDGHGCIILNTSNTSFVNRESKPKFYLFPV